MMPVPYFVNRAIILVTNVMVPVIPSVCLAIRQFLLERLLS